MARVVRARTLARVAKARARAARTRARVRAVRAGAARVRAARAARAARVERARGLWQGQMRYKGTTKDRAADSDWVGARDGGRRK